MAVLAILAVASAPAQAAVTETWVNRYSNGVNSLDEAFKVVLDAAGDVVVTGSTDDGITGRDMLTLKYSGADGSVMWQTRYNGPASSDDVATALAVDSSGNGVVTGKSDGRGGDYDYYTAKFAAADGALLWEKANSVYARNLAFGPKGMMVVTGSSGGYTSNFATVVYRENLPPLSVALVPTGIRFRFSAVPGHSYRMERAPAVAGPWSVLATPTAPLDGFID